MSKVHVGVFHSIFFCDLYCLPKTLFQQVCILSSSVVRRHFRLLSSKFLVGWASLWEGGFLSFILLVQFNSFNVPSEIFNKWRWKSSVLFILRNCFNFRAARNKNIASLLSSHECLLKKLDSLFRQLSLSVTLFFNFTIGRCYWQQNKDQGRNSKDIPKRNMEHGLREAGVVMMIATAPGASSHRPSPLPGPGFAAEGRSPCCRGPTSPLDLTQGAPAASSIPRGAAHTTALLCASPFP